MRLLIALVAVLASVAVAPAALAHHGLKQDSLTGTLRIQHGDDFGRGTASFEYVLETLGGRVPVRAERRLAERLAGKHVKLYGKRDGATFVAAYGEQQGTAPALAAAATGTKRVAVLLVNFTNDTRQPWTTSQVAGVVFTNSNSVNAYYQDVSYGQLALTGDVFGWYTLDDDNAGCEWSSWASQARQKAAAAGVSLSGYTNVVFAFPQASSCGWAGLAYLPGSESWINGAMNLRVVGHELGHNFGVHHAATISCSTGGVRVTWSSSCTTSEYGDPFTIMGSAATRHHVNWHRAQLGWLPDAQTVTTSGTYTVAPAELTGGSPRLLRVARGDGSYLNLEFRQPAGSFDDFSVSDPVVNGVSVRLAPALSSLVQSQLLDATPATSGYGDAPLGPGTSFLDPLSGARISTISVSPAGASVSIELGGGGGDTTAPSAPGSLSATAQGATSIALAWTAATDAVGVTGYRIYRNGQQIATTTGLSHTSTGLAPSTSYSFEVRAYDAAGNVGPGRTASATTTADTTAPGTPGPLSATGQTSSSIALAWTAATDNVGVAGYRVYRGGVQVGTTTGLSYTDTGLAAATSYAYEVRAFDAAGNVGAARSGSATTLTAGDTTAPSAPTGLAATVGKGRRVDLRWNAASDDVGVTGYRVFRGGVLVGQVSTLSLTDRPGRGTFTYTVRAVDAAGNVGAASAPVTVTT